ncbi:hypothetical protein B0T24DRAFT_615912 [Lasiosphaeria ovina]|uniref:Uncharacterized protein n=1 Tax=Lasiosphaeria ovina TaxID=92902 RepID=A0AAE0NFT1_9PEZI|nr:hypothetical protein B0T24DRAFT_615912 [Lasiosphaeria ovina]
METILVVGATGNIGVSAVTTALRSERNVLAIVRNQDSAKKLVKHIGSSEGITFVEADVTSETGLKGVVDQVRAGKLPAFQHVFTCVGGDYITIPLSTITTSQLRDNMNRGFEANFFAYRDTIGYLVEQGKPATWTLCTGSQGDAAVFALPALTQGPLYSLATAAARENEATNVRVNELYLAFRVEVDTDAAQHGVTSATEFSAVYKQILDRQDVRSSRVRVEAVRDITELRFQKKF